MKRRKTVYLLGAGLSISLNIVLMFLRVGDGDELKEPHRDAARLGVTGADFVTGAGLGLSRAAKASDDRQKISAAPEEKISVPADLATRFLKGRAFVGSDGLIGVPGDHDKFTGSSGKLVEMLELSERELTVLNDGLRTIWEEIKRQEISVATVVEEEEDAYIEVRLDPSFKSAIDAKIDRLCNSAVSPRRAKLLAELLKNDRFYRNDPLRKMSFVVQRSRVLRDYPDDLLLVERGDDLPVEWGPFSSMLGDVSGELQGRYTHLIDAASWQTHVQGIREEVERLLNAPGRKREEVTRFLEALTQR